MYNVHYGVNMDISDYFLGILEFWDCNVFLWRFLGAILSGLDFYQEIYFLKTQIWHALFLLRADSPKQILIPAALLLSIEPLQAYTKLWRGRGWDWGLEG